MDDTTAMRLLQTMIDYFAAGNKQSDKAAKEIIEWDFEYLADWQAEIRHLREAGEWTGLRAPEADILIGAMRLIQQRIKALPQRQQGNSRT